MAKTFVLLLLFTSFYLFLKLNLFLNVYKLKRFSRVYTNLFKLIYHPEIITAFSLLQYVHLYYFKESYHNNFYSEVNKKVFNLSIL